MAYSNVIYTGTGSQTNFAVPFPYLNQAHVYAYVNGSPASFTWNSPSTISITPAPASGATVVVQRNTPAGQLVSFTDGSTVSGSDLNTANLQTIYIAQETVDAVATKVGLNIAFGSYDFGSLRLSSVGTPLNAGDATNKSYVDTTVGTVSSTLSSHIGAGGTAHALATEANSGFLSAADKAKIDNLSAVASSGQYADLLNKPSLATVATSGSYGDLTGKPTLGGAAALNVGTTAGTVAAGNDSRITGALQASVAASTYAPLNGTNATGTWPISITGNAASASAVAWGNVSGRPTGVSAFTNDSGYATSSGANLTGGATISGGLAIAAGVPSNTSGVLYNNAGSLYWNGASLANGASANGTSGYLGQFTGATSIRNSIVYQSGSNIGFGTTSPGGRIHSAVSDGNNAAVFSGDTNLIRCTPTSGDVRVGALNSGQTAYSALRLDGSLLALNSITGGNVGIGTTDTYAKLHATTVDGNNAAIFAGASNLLRITPLSTEMRIGSLNSGQTAFSALSIYATTVNLNASLAIQGTATAPNWLTGFVTPEMFGAVGNGTTDDTSAVQAAFNDGRPVYLPGTYKITSTISKTVTYPLLVFGRGRGSGIHAYHTTGDALSFNVGTPGSPFGGNGMVTCRDFEIVSHAANANAGITVNTGASSGSAEPQLFAENIHILPSDASGNTGFSVGMYLGNARNMTLIGCLIIGRYFAYNGSGIFWNAYSASSAPVDLHVIDCQIMHWYNGVNVGPQGASSGQNDAEGFYMKGCTILAVYTGISATSSDGSSDLFTVVDTHINCRKYGVYTVNWRRVKIRGLFILMGFSQSGDSPTYGIYNRMNNGAGQDGDVSNNNISYENVAGVVSSRIGIECSINMGNMYTNVNNNVIRQATTAYNIASSCFANNNNSY